MPTGAPASKSYANYRQIHHSLDLAARVAADGGTVHELMVLIALARRANKDGECYPSLRTIAADSILSTRRVQKSIQWLEKHRYVAVTQPHAGKVNHYRLIDYGSLDYSPIDTTTHVQWTGESRPIDTGGMVQCATDYGLLCHRINKRISKEEIVKGSKPSSPDGEAKPASSFSFSQTQNPEQEQEQSAVEETTRGAGAEPRIEEQNVKGEKPGSKQETSTPNVNAGANAPSSPRSRNIESIPRPLSRPRTAHLGGPVQPRMPVPGKTEPVPVKATYVDDQGIRHGSSTWKDMHPPKITGAEFSFLDYAFAAVKEAIGDLTPKEIRRIAYYHWHEDRYWRGKIDSAARFREKLPTMAGQVPEFYRMPGSANAETLAWPPDCEKCSGPGCTTIEHPAYPGAPGRFQASQQCECVVVHPAPWRFRDAIVS